MYDFTGVPCSVCHKAFEPGDDIVVCPDCGAPYHRACYEASGHCIFLAKHAEGFEWQAPPRPPQPITCDCCGTVNPPKTAYCKDCGAPLGTTLLRKGLTDAAPESARDVRDAKRAAKAQQNGGASAGNRAFDYEAFYSTPYRATPYRPSIDPNDTIEGIPAAEWIYYLGPNGNNYLTIFKQMDVMHRKYAVSLSAMLFGPFYFFYRKAWKPAFAFLAAELALNIPTLITLLQLSGSPLAPALSDTAISIMSTVASVIGFVLMVVRGMYGFYFYRKSAAARIRRVQARYDEPNVRGFALSEQGGTSVVAVLAAMALLAFLGTLFTSLLGPDLDAVVSLLYG
jgi:hypothetical protein